MFVKDTQVHGVNEVFSKIYSNFITALNIYIYILIDACNFYILYLTKFLRVGEKLCPFEIIVSVVLAM
jgi:hypothetical protein